MCLALALSAGLWTTPGLAAGGQQALHLTAGQKEFLCLEPMLVTLRLDAAPSQGLPPAPGDSKLGTLRFEIDPAVKQRPGARPLPLEGQDATINAARRHYDLLEWFAFPDTGGPWTVRAVFEQNGAKLVSETIAVSISKPAKGNAEFDPMSRLHHTPWSNYDTNCFCGDTFDLVQKWPTSQFAKYCHYWNGRYSQSKKEYDKAIASYRTVIEKYPGFVLADAASFGVVECLYAQKKLADAETANTALRHKLDGQATKAGAKPATVASTVDALVNAMSVRITRELASK
jgi:hypothetical protein